jgi:hypothetical protein
MHVFRYAELGFWSYTGLNLAHGIIATLSGHYASADATHWTRTGVGDSQRAKLRQLPDESKDEHFSISYRPLQKSR